MKLPSPWGLLAERCVCCPVRAAYDSVVFKVGARPGGSWLLFSTMQGRPMADGTPLPRQSDNLYNWSNCNSAAELINVGEG